jgi:hypothetical protein
MHERIWWMISIALQTMAAVGVIVVWFEGRKYEVRQSRRNKNMRWLYFCVLRRVELMGTVQAELVRKIEASEGDAGEN